MSEAENTTSADVLVVASKVKKYVKEKASMNTSDKIMPMISEKIKIFLDEAIEKAKADGRKTLMDRDF